MPAQLARGALLKDRYRLERLLGRGGMASVWLGHDHVLERPVAIKVLSDTVVGDPEYMERFRREARVAASLSHANLAGVYDFSEEGERAYLVLQYVPGRNLAAHLADRQDVDCGRLARELLEAVAHIHEAGILHRDIKPQNILIEPEGRAKLLDFGIAVPHDATPLTRTGLVLGTRRYAAPEVIAGGQATERSDLYSCGVVIGCCLGRHPSKALRSLVDSMTCAAPSARPASAHQALARLGRGEAAEAAFKAGEARPAPAEMTPGPEPRAIFEPTAPLAVEGLEQAVRRRRIAGAMAPLLGAAAAILVVILVVAGGSGENRGRAVGATAKRHAGTAGGAATAHDRPVSTAAGADPSRGGALNEEGFALIQAGDYRAAVPILRRAVGSFPPGSEDVNYAYALFNLGSALRLSGRPAAAIPVLERRLRIPNQTAAVRRELAAARREAG